MRTFIPALIALSLFSVACNNDAETSEETAHTSELAGEWVGQVKLTDEQIDEQHTMFPDGDREAVERAMRLSQEWMVYTLKLNEDQTASFGISGREAEPFNGTWVKSDDGAKITLNLGSSTQTDQTLTPFEVNVAQDNQSITMIHKSGERYPVTFTRPGAVEIVKPSFVDSFEYAASGSDADFVGSWSRRFEKLDSVWNSLRGRMSEEDAQAQMAELNIDTSTLIFSDDMTYHLIDKNVTQDGSWSLSEQGSIVTLTSENAGALIDKLKLTKDKGTLVMHDMKRPGVPVLYLIKAG